MNRLQPYFQVVPLVHPNGERLPCLVERISWLPLRLANRWAVRYRRFHVKSATLRRNLHELAKLHEWARTVTGITLDDYLLADQLLTARHLESLALYLRQKRDGVITPATFNSRLNTIENFLSWVLYPTNRGGQSTRSLAELSAERSRLRLLCQSLHLRGATSPRQEPLSTSEVEAVRQALQPSHKGRRWLLPADGFSPAVALRNWLMVELALQLGLRRGELLKLRLDSVPRGAANTLLVRRLPDDPADSRVLEPAVKTAERKLPLPPTVATGLRAYITLPTPVGRTKGNSPYLFVTGSGDPLSIAAADNVVQAVSRMSGVAPLSWHRFRHTWAERVADNLLDQPNGLDRLMYLGGWTHRASPTRYIGNALARRAADDLRRYQLSLYSEEATNG